MKNPLWAKAIENCADPQRARHYHQLLAAAVGGQVMENLTPDQISVLVALFSGSLTSSDWLVANPDCLRTLDREQLSHPRRAQGLRREVDQFLKPALAARDFSEALAKVRRFKQREMLRIAARDLSRVANAVDIILEISDVADVCLDTVWQICAAQLGDRFGRPYQQDPAGRWQATTACVIGLGKLGGQELNYSSDVDVLFVYAEEGQTFRESPKDKAKSPRALSSHQFFNRLAESFIAEVTRQTPEGTLFRIDLRLRPEGDAGPLCRSLESYENYYAQWGQTWERMMLIKARRVAGDEMLGHEFAEMVQPFRFPRSLNQSVLREVAEMKDRIENEVVKQGELERNVKLGRGGIREIEFVAQSLQLLHAGRSPFLQTGQTLPCLAKLAEYQLLTGTEARDLTAAYGFLRDIEHRCQMEANLQTHTIPAEGPARERLAKLMGFARLGLFNKALRTHTGNVRRTYDRLFRAEATGPASPFPRDFEGAEAEWKNILAMHQFREPDAAFRFLKEFAEGPGYVHVSARTTELARQLIPKIFALCPRTEDGGQKAEVRRQRSEARGQKAEDGGQKAEVRRQRSEGRSRVAEMETPTSDVRPPASDLSLLSDPDRVLARLDNFITAYGTRSVLFEMWNSKPAMFRLLLLLFDRSEFLAEVAIRTPDLIDDLVEGERLRQRKTAEEIFSDLDHGRTDPDQLLWMRRYHTAELLRLGLRDILGLADFEQNLFELSALADACLRYALQVVMREHRLKRAPFAIIGLGKLGGCEINYGSDLDLVFVTDAKPKDLPKLQKLAARVMDLLSRRTEQGIVFPTDARLRPNGEKGLLVNTLAAYEAYYRQRAQLWEIQSLTRVRFVAGDEAVGRKFQELASRLTDFKTISEKPLTRSSTTLSPSDGEREGPLARSSFLPVGLPSRRAYSPEGRRLGEVKGLQCFTPDWKAKIHEMRMRIERERTPQGKDDLAIKTGKGGLMDAEFIAQTLCLEHGWQEAHTLRALERARDAVGVQASAGPGGKAEAAVKRGPQHLGRTDFDKLIENYRQLRRVEGILRRWSYEGETVLPDEPAPYYRVSVRCGFATPEAFRGALAKWRAAIREVYLQVFAG